MQLIIKIFAFSLFASCLGLGEPDLPEKVTTSAGEVIYLPKTSKNNETLLGVDENKNGVRDDVEIFVYENYGKSEKEFKWAILMAKSYGKYFARGIGEENAEYLMRLEAGVSTCIMWDVGEREKDNIVREMRDLIFDSWSRKLYRKKMIKSAGAVKVVLPTTDEQCDEIVRLAQ